MSGVTICLRLQLQSPRLPQRRLLGPVGPGREQAEAGAGLRHQPAGRWAAGASLLGNSQGGGAPVASLLGNLQGGGRLVLVSLVTRREVGAWC